MVSKVHIGNYLMQAGFCGFGLESKIGHLIELYFLFWTCQDVAELDIYHQ